MLKKNGKVFLLIIILGFFLYCQTLFFDFTYLDDNVLILDNFHFISKISHILTAFKQDVFYVLHGKASYYRPILITSFILDAQIGKTTPFFYHLSNIFIHLLAAWLVFIFLRKASLVKNLASLFSLLFVVHPILTQAVAWIPGRNDILLAIFALSAFIFLIDFLKKKDFKFFSLHLIFFALALFTKETALALVFLFVLYPLLLNRKSLVFLKENIFLLSLSWSAIIIFWFFLRLAALGDFAKITLKDAFSSLISNLPAISQLIGKVFFPFNLSVLPSIPDTSFLFGFLAIALLFFCLLLSKKKRLNFILFGGLWFLVLLLPSLVRPEPKDPNIFILEHRVYLPLVGLFILLQEIDFLKNLKLNQKKTRVLCVLFLAFFALTTFIHSFNFKNRLTFWEAAAKTSPSLPLAHRNLGVMYFFEGWLDKAELAYQKALELNPNEPMVHNNLGLILMERKMYQEAESQFLKEREINPSWDKVCYNLGLLYFKQGRLKEAENYWQKTIEINPDHQAAYQSLIAYYLSQEDFNQANYLLNRLRKRGYKPNLNFLNQLSTE